MKKDKKDPFEEKLCKEIAKKFGEDWIEMETEMILAQKGLLTPEQKAEFLRLLADDSTTKEPTTHNFNPDRGPCFVAFGENCESRPCPACGDHYGACFKFETICPNCQKERIENV